jgi:hypothetical protein
MTDRCNAVVLRCDEAPFLHGCQCKRAAVVGQFCRQHAAMDSAGRAVFIYEWRGAAPEDIA